MTKMAGFSDAIKNLVGAGQGMSKTIGSIGKFVYRNPRVTIGLGALGAGSYVVDNMIKSEFNTFQTFREKNKMGYMRDTNELLETLVNQNRDIATPKSNPMPVKKLIQRPLV